MSKIQKLHIQMIGDIACPWCYIGFQRIQKALQQATVEYELEWIPFELFPQLSVHGVDRMRHMISIFGSQAKMKSVFTQVTLHGLQEGLELNFERIPLSINTFNLHRLIWKAKQFNQQSEVILLLFQAYFTEGQVLNSFDRLSKLMTRLGWNPHFTQDFLIGKEGAYEVQKWRSKMLAQDIRSVPFFIVNNEYSISGAQPTAVFDQLFEQVIRNQKINQLI